MPPTLSVVTPTFDCGIYLPRSYHCLAEQTFGDWEWVVVDDGSSDDTPVIMEELCARDNRVRYIRYTPHRGRAYARTVSLHESCGQWSVNWDADDMYFPMRLEKIEEARVQDFDFFCSYAVVVDNDLQLLGVRGFAPIYRGLRHPQFVHATLACRLPLAREIGYDPKLQTVGQIGEDFRIIMVLSSVYRGCYHHDALMINQNYREVFLRKSIDINTIRLRELRALFHERVLGINRLDYAKVMGWQLARLAALQAMRVRPAWYLATVPRRSMHATTPGWTLSEDKSRFLDRMRNRFAETLGKTSAHSL